jgi:hypothetical protein
MGVWLLGAGTLKITPKLDERMIEEYIKFSKRVNPYECSNEYFPNPWFFDEDNNLQCRAGKFAEPSLWIKYVMDFFNALGYELDGDPNIIGEGEIPDFWEKADEKEEKYRIWLRRKKQLESKMED